MKNDILSLREIQLEELEILKNVINFLDNKNIKYFLGAGSLLGAIRHNGFIPWDDDVDIFIPRLDYKKFLNAVEKEKINNDYEVWAFENGKHQRPFCKVVNKKIPVESECKLDTYLWIDIFPLDKLPADKKESQKVIKKILFLQKQIIIRTMTYKEILEERKNIIKKILKILFKLLTYRHSLTYYSKQILRIIKQCENSNSNKLGNLVWPGGKEKILSQEWFDESEKVRFENITINVPIGWNEYLKAVYGNYMAVPLESERISHKTIARKID